MENISQCPVCANSRFSLSTTIADHFLTGEPFQIMRCEKCGFLFTNPRPTRIEISRYYHSDKYLSHSNNKTGLLSYVYNFVRKISLKRKHRMITRHKSPGSILDIGCGTGEFLNFMNRQGWKTTGIEPAASPREFAKQHYNLDIFDEIELDNLPTGGFDVISLWHVLEHVPDLNNRIDQLKRLLTKDGLLVIALPNCESWDAVFYQEYWAAWDVPRHFYHFSKSAFSLLIKNHELDIFSIHPMKFDAFYISLLSEKYKQGKAKLLNALINGLRSNFSANRKGNNYSSLIYLIKKQNV